MICETFHMKAPVRAIKFRGNSENDLIWAHGHILTINGSEIRLPVSERIICIEAGLNSSLFIITEFKLFLLNEENTLKSIAIPIRDRTIRVLDEGNRLWVVQSRGCVLEYHLDGTEYRFIRSCTLKESSSVFYSASINRLDENSLEIAFGTIFSGILITNFTDSDFTVIQHLNGHKGTIFDLKYHPNDSNLLVSCSDDRSVRVWQRNSSEFKLKFNLLGHDARVWSLDIQSDFISTVSEDDTCRIWNITNGECVDIIESDQYSKSIWSVSMNKATNLIAFGSNDGSVILHNLKKRPTLLFKDFCIPEVFGNIKNLICAPDGSCFAATSNNKVVKITADSVELVFEQKNFGRLPAMVFFNDTLFLADESGCLYSFIDGKLSKILQLPAKISSIFNQEQFILLETVTSEIYLYSFESDSFQLVDYKKRIKITSFFKLNSTLFIGTRRGILVIFENEKFVKEVEVSKEESLKSIKVMNGNLFILDRTGVEFGINLNDHEIVSRNNRIGKGICEGYFGHSTVSSFHQNNFLISDLHSGIVFDKIQCGGSHRLWSSSTSNDSFGFSFISNGKLTVYSGSLERGKIVSKRSHGKEIRCSHVLEGKFVFSGSEDGLLLVSTEDGVNIVNEIRLINLSIKCITSIKIETNTDTETDTDIDKGDVHYIFIGGSNETIEVFKFNCKTFNFIQITTCPKQIQNIETRILSVDVRSGKGGKFYLLAGYSDASIRLFEFDPFELIPFKLEFCLNGVHYKRGVQQVKFISEISTDGQFNFISAAPDGCIRAWQQDGSELWNFKMHENGINSIDYFEGNILTGGEDGSIGLIELNGCSVKRHSIFKQVHNSIISGVKFLNSSSKFISASINRFININSYLPDFSLIQRKKCLISDISSISLTNNNHLTVFGAGIESFKIEED